MKKGINLILTVVVCLLTLVSINFAQDIGTEIHVPANQGYVPRVPRACERFRNATPVMVTKDVVDNFTSPTATSPSPYLQGVINAYASAGGSYNPNRVRIYDTTGSDKAFGDSFPIRACRICAVTFNMFTKKPGCGGGGGGGGDVPTEDPKETRTAENKKMTPCNDTLNVWGSPDAGGTPTNLYSYSIGGDPDNTTMYHYFEINGLPGTTLNNYMGSVLSPTLDLYIQDDTAIDYAQVAVWYY